MMLALNKELDEDDEDEDGAAPEDVIELDESKRFPFALTWPCQKKSVAEFATNLESLANESNSETAQNSKASREVESQLQLRRTRVQI
ncbi:GL21625 [Drosophila persimilis]|uniref:GL21625 n=1 Tax=Drosophila persimilis TaxID=7234 RepID=B4H6W3_DROPE|nr:GL21625 [Drosophila persimilis]